MLPVSAIKCSMEVQKHPRVEVEDIFGILTCDKNAMHDWNAGEYAYEYLSRNFYLHQLDLEWPLMTKHWPNCDHVWIFGSAREVDRASCSPPPKLSLACMRLHHSHSTPLDMCWCITDHLQVAAKSIMQLDVGESGQGMSLGLGLLVFRRMFQYTTGGPWFTSSHTRQFRTPCRLTFDTGRGDSALRREFLGRWGGSGVTRSYWATYL
jgi:hypothetical protein